MVQFCEDCNSGIIKPLICCSFFPRGGERKNRGNIYCSLVVNALKWISRVLKKKKKARRGRYANMCLVILLLKSFGGLASPTNFHFKRCCVDRSDEEKHGEENLVTDISLLF